jgi:hypothetical protein
VQQGEGPETAAATPQLADASSSRVSKPQQIDYDGAGKRLMDACVQDASNNTARLDRDKSDWLNLLFDRGGPDNQYVIWDAGTNRWVTRGTDPKKGGLPEWMPRPVTNLMANKCDGVAAILNQSDPSKLCKPNTDDDEDLATAEVAENAIPVLLDEIDYDGLKPIINRQITLTDKVAIIVHYDNDEKHGTADIQGLQCLDCLGSGADEAVFLPQDLPEDAPDECPNCGGPLEPAVNPQTGMPIGTTMPIGKMCASFHPGFAFSLPRSAKSHRADKNPWVLFHDRYAWEEASREFPEAADKLKDKGGWKGNALQRQYADAMSKLTGPRTTRENAGSDGKADGPVLYRLYHDPIDDGEYYFPEGFYGVMLNGELIHKGPLEYQQRLHTGEKRPFKNVIIRTFRATPGSPYGKPPADDLVPLQYSRNLLEALLLAILLHNASPRTFLPLSVTLEKPITGTPGETIPYRSTTPGEVPTTAQGMNPPEGLYRWIEQIDAKFDELSKLNSVLQGERPAGDPTLGEIEILKERGESAFAEPLMEIVHFERTLCRMLLWIAQDTLWHERLRQVQGDNAGWEISKFSAADLTGNVDVQIEQATAWPKSAAAEKKALAELLSLGVFQLMQVNPELAVKILEKYNALDLLPSTDIDRRQIRRELDRWKHAHVPDEIKPPDPVLQNLPMHLLHKLNFLKTEEYEELVAVNQPLAMAMRMHVQMIQQLLAQQAAAAAMQAAAAGGQGGTDTQGPPSGEALDAALQSGALAPANAGGVSLDHAVQAGALEPAGVGNAMVAPLPSIDDMTTAGALIPADAAHHAAAGLPAM